MSARSVLSLGLAALLAPAAAAEVKPHPLFSDHVVLQRGGPVPVWGTASPGEKVTVELKRAAGGAQEQHVAAVEADKEGNWKAVVGPAEPGAGFTLTIAGTNTVALKNVSVGDVWLCSGQSNMEWNVKQLTRDDQAKQVAAKAANPNLKLFVVPNRPFPAPQSTFPAGNGQGQWLECTPETVLNFSAVGYFFGRDVQAAQKVPVGLIASDWGGTPAEAWTSVEGLKKEPNVRHYADNVERLVAGWDAAKGEAAYQAALAKYKEAAAKAKEDGKTFTQRPPVKPGPGGVNQNSPAALFNGMIAPIVGFPIKGAIWYQGESNASRAWEYRSLLPAMVRDWRGRWGSEFPFLVVQLAPYKADGSDKVSYAELRRAQVEATQVLPKAGLAVITDAGEENDIHPQKKEPVGQRLALAARAVAYGEKVPYRGPTFKEARIDGDKMVLTFDNADGGLEARGGELAGFSIAGEDNKFVPAKATIQGDAVVVSADGVVKPAAARFGWVNFAKPELNLFNKAGLPAVPFCTYDAPWTTMKK